MPWRIRGVDWRFGRICLVPNEDTGAATAIVVNPKPTVTNPLSGERDLDLSQDSARATSAITTASILLCTSIPAIRYVTCALLPGAERMPEIKLFRVSGC